MYVYTCIRTHAILNPRFLIQGAIKLVNPAEYGNKFVHVIRMVSHVYRPIQMELREIGWCNMDWIHLAQDRDQWRALVNTVINLPVA
jgi:hypothetical protein